MGSGANREHPPPPRLPSLCALTRELRALHEAWSHPDAGGEYATLVCERRTAGVSIDWRTTSYEWRALPVSMNDTLDIVAGPFGSEYVPGPFGSEYVPGSVARECERCEGCGMRGPCDAGFECWACNGSGRVSVPSPFDAVAAARRLLAAARDGGAR